MADTLSQFIALAPAMIPADAEGVEISRVHYMFYQDLLSINNLDDHVYGPKFDERMGDFCQYARFLGGEASCKKVIKSNNDLEGMEPMSTKLLFHYMQLMIEGKF